MSRLFICALLLAASSSALAECWEISNLRGYTARRTQNYLIREDGFSGRTYELKINGTEAVVGPPDIKCEATSSMSALCVGEASNKGTVETWVISTSTGKAFYTQSIGGQGINNGAILFVGDITGNCNAHSSIIPPDVAR